MSAVSDTLEAPPLTLPEAEAALLRRCLGPARVVLEYGAGGSTVLAAEAGRTVFTVESDPDWIARLTEWFAAHPPDATVHLHHGDIGPTGKWGNPRDDRAWARFHRYPLGVWEREDFVHPDLVLIDGRFRVGCFLSVLYRASRPVTVLFDDYTGRAPYHVVERFGAPAEIAGRMARFEVSPRAIAPGELAWVMDQYTLRR